MSALRQAGWDLRCNTIVFVIDGTFFRSTVDTLKQLLPKQSGTVEQIITKLNKNAVIKAHDILVAGRIQEKAIAVGYPPARKHPR